MLYIRVSIFRNETLRNVAQLKRYMYICVCVSVFRNEVLPNVAQLTELKHTHAHNPGHIHDVCESDIPKRDTCECCSTQYTRTHTHTHNFEHARDVYVSQYSETRHFSTCLNSIHYTKTNCIRLCFNIPKRDIS